MLGVLALGLSASLTAAPSAWADFNACAISWTNFTGANGFVSDYTYRGQTVRDHETSADPTNGGAAVTPAGTDLASGSPSDYPGPYPTPAFGYYDGGTPWNANDPTTMNDDYIFFRWRLTGNPVQSKGDFDSYHWNVLLDVDGDGYKEYWVDLEGSYQASTNRDRVQILYDNADRQNVPDADAARVGFYAASSNALATGCGAPSPGHSHTRVQATGDGTGDYFLEVQIPMTAFKDLQGNQVLRPDSPVAFAYSTSASNTDPLQKDYMMDFKFTSLTDPIQFGDVVTPSGLPRIQFVDAALASADAYTVGENVFVALTDPLANVDKTTPECIRATVTNPATGDDEPVTLCETGPSTGIFTNLGGACGQTITYPSPAPVPPSVWLVGLRTSASTLDETWTLTYVAAAGNWTVTGSTSGLQPSRAAAGAAYATATGGLSFTLYDNAPVNGTTLSFCTKAASPLATSTAAGADSDGTLHVASGDTIYVSYTNRNAYTVTDAAAILGPCASLIQFTRADGLATMNFQLAADPGVSDRVYVTVTHFEANTNPATLQTISVTLTGYDTQLLSLTETGVNTGVFRNTTGLQTKISDGTVTPNDGLWEDVDAGSVTASYAYSCGGSSLSQSTTASVFSVAGGGRVAFTNGAGTQDVSLYTAGQPVFVTVTDTTYACPGPLQVTLTSPSGDSETITLYQTFTGSGVYRNLRDDLVTTAGSAVVTSASSTFLSDAVPVGAAFIIATGPDMGTYAVQSVDSQTRITLTSPLTASRTGISFSARPLTTGVFDGASTANDRVLEAADGGVLTVSYTDCNDGDSDPANNVKTDTALFNAPALVINRVLFAPDSSTCQTEYVEVYNSASAPVLATGYTIQDEDAEFVYTVPQFAGSDLTLQPGQKLLVSVGGYFTDFFDPVSNTYYFFMPDASYPSNRLGGLGDTDPADQLTLRDGGGTVVDYLAWSGTLQPSVDFQSDDSPAVLAAVWQDDAFREVASMGLGQALDRTVDGFDTNRPSDWELRSDNTCQTIIDAYALTRATLLGLRVDRAGVVEFATASQQDSLAFNVYEADGPKGGALRILNDAPVQVRVRDSVTPLLYHVDTRPIASSHVALEEVDTHGRRRLLGPFAVGDALLAGRLAHLSARLDAAGARSDGPVRRLPAAAHAATGSSRPVLQPIVGGLRRGLGVVVAVRGRGVVTVPTAAIGAQLGARVQPTLRLTNRGINVPYWRTTTAEGAPAISFRSEALATDHTDVNAYVMTSSWSRSRMNVTLAQSAPPPGPGFVRIEKGTIYLPDAPADGDAWLWDLLFSDSGRWPYDWWDAGAGTFDLPDVATSSADVSVRIRLIGRTEHAHSVVARINGVTVGSLTFAGAVPALLEGTIPAAALQATGNELVLDYTADTAGPEDLGLAYLDTLDLGLTLAPASNAIAYALRPWDPEPRVAPGVDYLILTHPDFLRQAERLAQLKLAEGLIPAVVDVRHAYDRHSGGIVEPQAIRALIRELAGRPLAGRGRLRYVVLVGDDTFDPLDRLGTGAVSFMPSPVVRDEGFGRIPSEGPYADLNDDGIPDLAIGRLPVATPQDADTLVGKIAVQGLSSGKLGPRHTFAVDNATVGDIQFREQAEQIARLLPAASIRWADVSNGIDAARTSLREGFQTGTTITHYFGHGGPEAWADEGLLTVADVAEIAEGPRATVLFAWACQAQWYVNVWGPSINEALLLQPQGGAVASFGPAGVTPVARQRELFERVYTHFLRGRLPLGEAIRRAKAEALTANPALRSVIDGWNLLGDPALRIR